MAEIAFGVLERECLDRRIGDTETLKKEITAWKQRRNQHLKVVDWRFTTRDARTRLAPLYPTIESNGSFTSTITSTTTNTFTMRIGRAVRSRLRQSRKRAPATFSAEK
jgi:hypothetical protein